MKTAPHGRGSVSAPRKLVPSPIFAPKFSATVWPISESVERTPRSSAFRLARPVGQQRNVLAAVIGGWRGRIAAVVGRDDQQIVARTAFRKAPAARRRILPAPGRSLPRRCDGRKFDRNPPGSQKADRRRTRRARPASSPCRRCCSWSFRIRRCRGPGTRRRSCRC